MLRVAVSIGTARLVCSVARTTAEQARGLQGRAPLAPGEGMLFPFHPPRSATFSMKTVDFPIDLVFADASGVVHRVIRGAQPGSRSSWTMPVVGAVVELPAGDAVDVTPGVRIRVAGQRLGIATYNLLRTLTEADVEDASLDEPRGEDGDGFRVQGDPPLDGGYYSKEPLHTPPGGKKDLVPAEERFKDHRLPDEGPDAMDQPNRHWHDDMGWWRPSDSIDPIRPGITGQRAGEDTDEVSVDLPTMVAHVLAGAVRAGIPWKPLTLNQSRDRAVVTPTVVGRWLHALGLEEGDRNLVHDIATSNEGLDAIGTAFIANNAADTANLAHAGSKNILVLTRRKQEQG